MSRSDETADETTAKALDVLADWMGTAFDEDPDGPAARGRSAALLAVLAANDLALVALPAPHTYPHGYAEWDDGGVWVTAPGCDEVRQLPAPYLTVDEASAWARRVLAAAEYARPTPS